MTIDSTSSLPEVEAYVIEYLESHLPDVWVQAIHNDDADALHEARALVPEQEWFDELGAAGLVTPDWPVGYGGLGLTSRQAGVVHLQLSRYKAPRFYNPIGINLAGPAILAECETRRLATWQASGSPRQRSVGSRQLGRVSYMRVQVMQAARTTAAR